jgi:hypothetical protein
MSKKSIQAGLAKARRVLARVRPKWLRRRGVVDVGLGFRLKGGRSTGEVALLVYVEAKIAKHVLNRGQEFPRQLSGVVVDVISIDGQRTAATVGSGTPVAAGSPTNPNAGTIGAAVRRLGDEFVYVLTCAHIAPANTDMFELNSDSVIGRVPQNNAMRVNRRDTARLDWAAIRALPEIDTSLGIEGAPRPYQAATAELNDDVYRITTAGETIRGRVVSTSRPINLGDEIKVDAIHVEPVDAPVFSIGGDSGCLLLRKNGGTGGTNLIGVIYGIFLHNGSNIGSAACKFDQIQPELKIDFANT